MPDSPLAVRGLTLLAAGFLGFDGMVLVALGVWGRSWTLAAIGLVLFVAAGLVLVYAARQRRRLAEIAAARRELRDETESLRRLLER